MASYKWGIGQYPARLSGGFQSPTEINAPRGCAGIRFGRCQLTLTRIPRQFSRARIEFGRTISRVLSCVIIYPGRPLPNGSSDRPEARRAAVLLLFGLAPDGACICPACYQPGGSLLHCLFTLTACAAVLFCCAFPRVTPAGRYPASCPAEPGLSSPGIMPAAITCPAESPSYQFFFVSAMPFLCQSLKQPPPRNSLRMEFCGTSSSGIPIK